MSDDDSKSTSDDTPKAPIKLNVTEGTSHKVEKWPMVGSCAYAGTCIDPWHGGPVTRRNGDNLSKHRYLLSAQTCKGLRSHDRRWIPFSHEHVRLRSVDTHG